MERHVCDHVGSVRNQEFSDDFLFIVLPKLLKQAEEKVDSKRELRSDSMRTGTRSPKVPSPFTIHSISMTVVLTFFLVFGTFELPMA